MRPPNSPDNRKILTLAAVTLLAASLAVPKAGAAPTSAFDARDAPARRLEVRVERIDAGPLKAEGVAFSLREAAGAPDPRSLSVQIGSAVMPDLSVALRDLDWRCERLTSIDPLVCEGPLKLGGRGTGMLAIDVSTARTGLRWTQGRRSLSVDKDLASPWRIEAQRVPVVWLKDFLAQLWASGRFSDGTISGSMRVRAEEAALGVDADLQLAGLAFDTPDGLIAGAGLSVPLTVRYEADDARRTIALQGRLAAGEALVAPIYLAVPKAGVGFAIDAESQPNGRWRLSHWRWDDGDALAAEGEATLAADASVLSLSARGRSPDLAALRARYLEGVLAPAGFGDLQLAGRGQGVFAFDAEGLSALEIDVKDTVAIDPKGRFSLAGLNGDLRWSRDAQVADSRLGWQAAALYGIGVEAATLAFRSRDGELALIEPARPATLGGQLRLDRFVWRPPRGEAPLRIEMGLALESLDLGSLSQRLGWPDFEGTIDGTLPNALFEDNRITFEGGLAMQLFGGEVRIDNLALERPFGIAPSLAANLRFQDIDLEPLTEAFGFGEITGRLDGRIRDLRLVDWTPVAFDARLLTDRNWDGSRRISQRAVQDISDLGGSGLVAGLQAQLLRTFDDFGYDRIGIGCVLRDNVCAMTGLKRRGQGFIIVEGRGLPRIEVVGFRREVDWPTLVSRLQDATERDTLRIE